MIQIEQVIQIVREASRLMLDVSFDITEKGGFENIVTSSDLAVQQYLCKHLSEILPESGFLCEEDDVNNLTKEYTWVIDPIDGTANYSRGIDQCAICVGLKHNDQMVMGVVYVPRTEEMFHAELGKGAFLNGKQIHVSDRPFANSVLCTALPVYHKEYSEVCSKIILDAFQHCNDIRRFGACAPELCYVAMGRADMYFEYLLSPWDFSAATLILSEAGGVFCDLEGNALTYTRPSGLIAANNKANLTDLTSIIQKYI